ncbi:uncharacterized protein G2W53_015628 [Senna tora]|uniref:Uncharacterized protein n=1 Tax=Senna tora TaxID=362788 RepID=A0A835C824_9FABA|nr:uncharacterized protein G2W53_015628 [Senna tora]
MLRLERRDVQIQQIVSHLYHIHVVQRLKKIGEIVDNMLLKGLLPINPELLSPLDPYSLFTLKKEFVLFAKDFLLLKELIIIKASEMLLSNSKLSFCFNDLDLDISKHIFIPPLELSRHSLNFEPPPKYNPYLGTTNGYNMLDQVFHKLGSRNGSGIGSSIYGSRGGTGRDSSPSSSYDRWSKLTLKAMPPPITTSIRVPDNKEPGFVAESSVVTLIPLGGEVAWGVDWDFPACHSRPPYPPQSQTHSNRPI